MEKTKYNSDMVTASSEIRALADRLLTVEDALEFISKDLKIAPDCVELILTTLGYIYRASDRICCTERLFRITKNYDVTTHTRRLTADGLDLLYHLVLNSVCRDETAKKNVAHNHPVIFNRFIQHLAEFDDKDLVQIDVALDEIYTELVNKYHITNLNTDVYHCMLEDVEKFTFNADGNVAKFIANMARYTYYIYNAEDIDKNNVVNDLSVNSTEIYICKETYSILADKIDVMFRDRIKAGLFFTTTATEEYKTNDDQSQEIKKPDISLNHFISMIADNYEKCNESDVIEAMIRQKLIKMSDDNNKIYINGYNKFLYIDKDGNISVKTDKLFELFFVVTSDYKLRCAIAGIDPNTIDSSGIINDYGYNFMMSHTLSISPMPQNSGNNKN